MFKIKEQKHLKIYVEELNATEIVKVQKPQTLIQSKLRNSDKIRTIYSLALKVWCE